MKQPAAPMSAAIKVITGAVMALTVGFLVAGLFLAVFLAAAGLLAIILLGCFLTAPVAYELAGDSLRVHTRLGVKAFSPVLGCTPVRDCFPGVRVCGNGGLFAGTGLFWCQEYGFYRAYVTSARTGALLWVETPKRRILISPADPGAFAASGDQRRNALPVAGA